MTNTYTIHTCYCPNPKNHRHQIPYGSGHECRCRDPESISRHSPRPPWNPIPKHIDVIADTPQQGVPASVLMQVDCNRCSDTREKHPDGAACVACDCDEFEWPNRVPVSMEAKAKLLDTAKLARALQRAHHGTGVRDHQGRLIEYDELQAYWQRMVFGDAERIAAAYNDEI